MGGVAALAQAAGHRVTGCDRSVYPPMSTQLAALGIELIEGYDPGQLDLAPDVVLVGNVMSRGNALIERLLDSGLPYTSGPQWLAEHVLRGRWALAVAGTHGKTTTSSMLAWILERAGLEPGFLIGGVPEDFGQSARLGRGRHFVVEADEYDTAFFDKRAKFVHYRPRTVILNNLEYDHADIYPDIAAIQWQFHLLLRAVPRRGLVIANAGDPRLEEVFAMGCWTPRESFAAAPGAAADWQAQLGAADGSAFTVTFRGEPAGEVHWPLLGSHNVANALAALAAAQHAGVAPDAAAAALASFRGVRRRMELRGTVRGVTVYDDFAHHPTAIATTIAGLRQRIGGQRIVAVLEPRSNTMKRGVHRGELAGALDGADAIWLHRPADLDWDLDEVATRLGPRARVTDDVDALAVALAADVTTGDHVLIMSNGGFGGLHGKLLSALGRAGAP